MSRYNHWWYDLTKPFRDVFFLLVIVPLIISAAIAARIVYGEDEWESIFERFVCRLTSHQWADEDKYGAEAVCLNCGEKR
jgi:hypothetical protein